MLRKRGSTTDIPRLRSESCRLHSCTESTSCVWKVRGVVVEESWQAGEEGGEERKGQARLPFPTLKSFEVE